MPPRSIATLLLALTAVAPALATGRLRAQAERQTVAQLLDTVERREQRTLPIEDAIVSRGPEAIPELSAALRTRTGCSIRLTIATLMLRIDAQQPQAFSAMSSVIRGECASQGPQDAMASEGASGRLARTAAGLPVLTGLIADKNPQVRRRVADAFYHLAEDLGSTDPQRQLPPAAPAYVDAVASGIRALGPLLGDGDDAVRCTTLAAMTKAAARAPAPVSAAAEAALARYKPQRGCV